jgi:hypothetical protein
MNVYIVWDKDRQEHGEIAELLDVFFSREDADAYTASELCWASETAVEEREVKGSMSETEIRNLIAHVLAGTRGGMRVVIGDSTPKQYDRADQMAGYIAEGVRRALTKLGYIKEATSEPEAASS